MPEQTEYGFTKIRGAFDLDLPGGGKVQVKPIDVSELFGMGLIEKLDTLGVKVQTEHVDRVKKPGDRKPKKLTKAELAAAETKQNDAVMKAMMGPDGMAPLRELIDRVCSKSVTKPRLEEGYVEKDGVWVEIPVSERDSDLNYPQDMDFLDKMHIFGAVLPSQDDLSRFRVGSSQVVGDLGHIAEASGDA